MNLRTATVDEMLRYMEASYTEVLSHHAGELQDAETAKKIANEFLDLLYGNQSRFEGPIVWGQGWSIDTRTIYFTADGGLKAQVMIDPVRVTLQ